MKKEEEEELEELVLLESSSPDSRFIRCSGDPGTRVGFGLGWRSPARKCTEGWTSSRRRRAFLLLILMPLPRGTRAPGREEGEVEVVAVVSSGEYLLGVVGSIGPCRGLLSRLLK